MNDTAYRSHGDVREHARRSALGGREIWANPHIGADAELWFEGWRSVPEDQRGTRPDLLPRSTRSGPNRRRPMSEAGIKALGSHTLKGSTPRPMQVAIHAEVAERQAARTPKPWASEGAGL